MCLFIKLTYNTENAFVYPTCERITFAKTSPCSNSHPAKTQCGASENKENISSKKRGFDLCQQFLIRMLHFKTTKYTQ